jgi:hypothetical protein
MLAGYGQLTVAMPPLQWPPVSIAIVAITALLAAPALLPAGDMDR